jgi:chromate transporter
MHREIVAERGWLTDRQFSDALSFCMLLPGPEAMQLATYSGWRLHGLRGGLLAGGLFILPGALVMLALAAGYVYFGTMGWIESLFIGLKAGISIIVLQALGKLAHRTLHNTADWLSCDCRLHWHFFRQSAVSADHCQRRILRLCHQQTR